MATTTQTAPAKTAAPAQQTQVPAKPANQQVAKRPEVPAVDRVKAIISSDKFKQTLLEVLPQHITPDRQARLLCSILNKTPKLADCDQASLLQAMLDCSSMGLEPDGRLAHLIPYGTKVTLIVGYKGLVELIYRSERVEFIAAFVVYSGDEFSIKYGANPDIQHSPTIRPDRGEILGAYAVAHLKGVSKPKFEWLPTVEIESVRKRSKAANDGPWVTDYAEMAKKTAIRRLSKTLPLSYEIAEAMDRDGEFEHEDRFRKAKPARVNVESPLPSVGNQTASTEGAAQLPPPSDPTPAQTTSTTGPVESFRLILGEEGIDESAVVAYAAETYALADVTTLEEIHEVSPKKFSDLVAKLPAYKDKVKSIPA